MSGRLWQDSFFTFSQCLESFPSRWGSGLYCSERICLGLMMRGSTLSLSLPTTLPALNGLGLLPDSTGRPPQRCPLAHTNTHFHSTVHLYNSGYAMVGEWPPHIVHWGRDRHRGVGELGRWRKEQSGKGREGGQKISGNASRDGGRFLCCLFPPGISGFSP